jgi:N-acetylglutamate synthase-like GNAT family acetyltransferase
VTTFQLESVDKWAAESGRLVYAHWQELGLDLDLVIDPDIAKMKAMEDIGMFKVLTAREDGRLVGYLLAVVSVHLHYRSSPPMFIVDAYYVPPEWRFGTGARMFFYARSVAKQLGTIKMYVSCKVHKDHRKFFEALGFKLSDYALIMRI